MSAINDGVPIKSYSKSQLAKAYGVHIDTFVKWMRPCIGKFTGMGYEKSQNILTPAMVKHLFEVIGEPPENP